MKTSETKKNKINDFEKRMKYLTEKALCELENILNDEEAPVASKIQAAKTLIDVAGLKKESKEIADISYEVFINRNKVECK